MSKLYYLRNKSLHGLPKFSLKGKFIQVGNAESINMLFIIPSIQDYMSEICTMVSEIHDNEDLVLGVKNFVESEGEISMEDLTFKFLIRAVPIFSVHKEIIAPKEIRHFLW